ncbi:helix-turn-helix transcriptional regulator [Blastococcus sp. TF02A-26]|uniref:helix-turn-helix domain-containing protein n=1 Tax=Blastococcus sp. TF02A-26 TaxID=2250577 RepID=UPI0011BF21C5|nr:helix-turn-helix transcriptional regulator [Blastococcus sp. TF02A-26]
MSRSTDPVERVAANVRAELGRQRRTRRQLAAAMKSDEHRVSKRVRGLVPFSADEIVQVARFLDVTVEELVDLPRTPVGSTAGAA